MCYRGFGLLPLASASPSDLDFSACGFFYVKSGMSLPCLHHKGTIIRISMISGAKRKTPAFAGAILTFYCIESF